MDDVLTIELTGPNAEPQTIDSRAALELGAAYLQLIEALAKIQERGDLKHHGIWVENKCVELRFVPNDLAVAHAVAIEAHRCISGKFPPPKRTQQHVLRVQKLVREQKQDGRLVKIKVSDWEGNLDTPPEKPPEPPIAITSVRAELLEVGGDKNPHIKIASQSEAEPFRVSASREQCESLGRFLYKRMDFDVRLRRNAEGHISEGALIDFQTLSDAPSRASEMLSWIDRAGKDWEEIQDPLKELGRDD